MSTGPDVLQRGKAGGPAGEESEKKEVTRTTMMECQQMMKSPSQRSS